MSYNDNPYYSPDRAGLEILATADVGEPYEFNMIVVWRDVETGEMLIGTDAGCSCPSPFENQTKHDLELIGSLGELVKYAEEAWNVSYYGERKGDSGYYAEEYDNRTQRIADLIEGVVRAR